MKAIIEEFQQFRSDRVYGRIILDGYDFVKKENMEGIFEIASKHGAMLRMNIYRPTNGIDNFSKQFMMGF